MFDVAFSFLGQDEELVVQLADLLEGRFKTFVYSRRQDFLGGTDGEESFERVFGRDTRLVVVCYRAGWGETPWTRIEATAIRNRAFSEGYDFAIWIPLDSTPLPKWVPSNRIWIGLDRWGLQGAASVIEARITEAGGEPRTETAFDQAVRMARQAGRQEERASFLHSERGVAAAEAEVSRLLDCVESDVAQINKAASLFRLTVQRRQMRIAVVTSRGTSLTITWINSIRNSLREAELIPRVWGVRISPDHTTADRFQPTQESRLELDLLPSAQVAWRSRSQPPRHYDSPSLSDFLLKQLLVAKPSPSHE